MKKTGRIDEARERATRFVQANPCNQRSPGIALEICELEREDASAADLERWLPFFREKGCKEAE